MKTIEFNGRTLWLVPDPDSVFCSECCLEHGCTTKTIPQNPDTENSICMENDVIYKASLIDAITHRLTE